VFTRLVSHSLVGFHRQASPNGPPVPGSMDYRRPGWVVGTNIASTQLDTGGQVAFQVTDVQKALKGQLTESG
jgi:hypothetical protein